MYISVAVKFFIAFTLAVAWFSLCFWLALPWIKDLSEYIGHVLSYIIIFGIALVPGFIQMFLFVAYILDKRQKNKTITDYPPISIIIAAYNEEDNIKETLDALSQQDYSGPVEIILVDDGSIDNTTDIVDSIGMDNITLIKNKHSGKASCLNLALEHATHELIVCIDADTNVAPFAVTRLVERLLSAPENTAAVAGAVLVKNSRASFITRLEEWDYFLAITAIKRVQSLLQGTLVAQGAFSLFRKEVLHEIGGWPNLIGEDIVMSWHILKKQYRVDFSEDAIAFTSAPDTYKDFFHQRSRWARGLMEAFKTHPSILITPRFTTFFIYWNLLFPLLDFIYLFAFIPGLILALFGHFFIVGPMTLAILPLAILYSTVFYFTERKLFNACGFTVRRNIKGAILYLLFYQILMAPACVHGYLSEFFQRKKSWGS